MAGHPRSLGSEHNGKPAVVSRWSQTSTSLKRLLWWRMAPVRAEVRPGDWKRVCRWEHGAVEETLGAEGKSPELPLCLPSADPQPTSPRRLTAPPCGMCSSSPNFRQPSKSQAGLVPVLLCQGKPGSCGCCVLRVCSPPLSRPLPTLSWHTKPLVLLP